MTDQATVLIVDDEQNHADGIVESLEKLPVKATAVYSGDHALQILQSQTIDVVVTDLKLGSDADGLAVLDEAKKQNPHTEVILITAYATIDTCKDALRRGAYDYLVKPIDIDQLRTLVTEAAKKALKTLAQQTIEVMPESYLIVFPGRPIGLVSLKAKRPGYLSGSKHFFVCWSYRYIC